MSDKPKHLYKLYNSDQELVGEGNIVSFDYRPDIIVFDNQYFHIKETKTTGDNENTHFYNWCSILAIPGKLKIK